ncbi:hypothetical protein MUK42_03552 [Musa troglodytarum]|uniref:Trichome birefringence-like N-terminal domain-containing protein n=1 Tax=Musa troglodytarum TaxID=320322 RepID=A0A9E7GJB7_9LILI|nr:hypothetical protein MUK42_03552 [Musa troglodytarum]
MEPPRSASIVSGSLLLVSHASCRGPRADLIRLPKEDERRVANGDKTETNLRLSRGLWVSGTKGGGVERGRRSGGGRECDWFEGEWVWDEGYPLYESKDCDFMDEGFRCSENGLSDRFYIKWRWQPAGCDHPRGGDWKAGGIAT